MYAHLFDHDNLYINKLEAIIDRFSEICGIAETEQSKVRDRLVNIISLDMLAKLAKRLPQDQQGILTSLKDTPNVEDIEKFKKNFQEQDILNEFHSSARTIIAGKISLIKEKLDGEKVQQLEDLVKLIGKF